MDAQRITARLLQFSEEFDPAELFPSVDDEASRFAIENPFAFALACCLDRGTKSSRLPDLSHAPGLIDAVKLVEMQLRESPTRRRDWSRADSIHSFRDPIRCYRLFKKSDLDVLLRKIRGTRPK